MPEEAFRSLIKGHRPTIDRADDLCRALGITMTIGTRVETCDRDRGDGDEEPREAQG